MISVKERAFRASEDQILRENYRLVGCRATQELMPHRSYNTVMHRAKTLGIQTPRAKEWELAEDKILRRCNGDLARAQKLLPGRSKLAIVTRSSRLGLGNFKFWKKSELNLIEKLRLTHGDEVLARMLGRTKKAVAAKRRELFPPLTARKTMTAALLEDVVNEVQKRGVVLIQLTRQLGCSCLKPKTLDPQIKTLSLIVSSFGGELYAEWDD